MAGVYAGVDVGGTTIAAALTSSLGQLLGPPIQVPTPSGPALASAITDLLAQVEEKAGRNAEAVGVGLPGFLDCSQSTLLKAFNIDLATNIPLAQQLRTKLRRPVVLVNDASAAAWGEAQVGSGRYRRRVICLTIGTGVGGGVVLNGRLSREVFEPGHMTVIPGGRECGCGRRGCLEAYASGPALFRTAQSLGFTQDREQMDGAIRTHDLPAIAALRTATEVLGRALASMALLLAPDCIVIGGGVSSVGRLLIQLLRDAYQRYSLPLPGSPTPELVAAELGNDAGIVGTALLARESTTGCSS